MMQLANNGEIQQFKDPARIPVMLRVRNVVLCPTGGNFSIMYTATVAKITDDGGQKKEEAPFRVVLKKVVITRIDVNRFREIYLLRLMATTYQHKNIVQLLYTRRSKYDNDKALMYTMVFKFMTSTLAQQRVEISRQRNILDIKLYTWQLFAGLYHLKRLEIIHRDVKPPNLLVEPSTGQLKIADFGSAIRCPYPRSTRRLGKYAVTRPYRPPELLLNATKYNCNADIWSAGCIFIELFLGRTLFSANDGPNLLQLVYKTVGMPSLNDLQGMNVNVDQFVAAKEKLVIWPMQELKEELLRKGFQDANIPTDLFNKILQFNPNRRLNGPDLLRERFFDELFEAGRMRLNNTPVPLTEKDRRLIRGTAV